MHLRPTFNEEQPWLKELHGKGVTELEILHGVLNNPEMAGRAFFYLRDPGMPERTAPTSSRKALSRLPSRRSSSFSSARPALRIESRCERTAPIRASWPPRRWPRGLRRDAPAHLHRPPRLLRDARSPRRGRRRAAMRCSATLELASPRCWRTGSRNGRARGGALHPRVLDALNQLDEQDHARSLGWLPSHPFSGPLRLIASTLPGETLHAEPRETTPARRCGSPAPFARHRDCGG